MKSKIIFLGFVIFSHIFCMEPEKTRERSSILPNHMKVLNAQHDIKQYLEDRKKNHINLSDLLQQISDHTSEFMTYQQSIARNKSSDSSTGSKSGKDIMDDFFSTAEKQAEENLEGAKKNLTWSGNTGRRNQLIAGGISVLSGIGKGIFDFVSFSENEDDSEHVTTGFNIYTDLGLILLGAYNIKNAWENAGSHAAYGQAKLELELIKAKREFITRLLEKSKVVEQKIDQLLEANSNFKKPQERTTSLKDINRICAQQTSSSELNDAEQNTNAKAEISE
ncbi:MAG: hypothetical protein AB7E68_02545 [Candidatus Babeliales bacterium]